MRRTTSRLFVIIPAGQPADGDRLTLTSDPDEARAACDFAAGDRIVDLRDDLPLDLLRHIGHAMVLVDESGTPTWTDDRYLALPDSIRDSFESSLLADSASGGLADRPVTTGDRSFYRLTCRADDSDRLLVVLIEITWMQQQRNRRSSLRAAGLAIKDLDRQVVTEMTVADRLRMLEDRIVRCVHEELSFDNFEIRLLDRSSKRLELVIAKNITPLKIGEVMYAAEHDNGISGWVAHTGKPYICSNVMEDPRYRDGLNDAASTLTVPLKIHDQVIGVLNVESQSANAFTRDDLELAEILAHYIADAMHMLDLLVVERFTTREQTTRGVLAEMDEPFNQLRDVAKALRSRNQEDSDFQGIVDRLASAVSSMRTRLEACVSGPRSILDAEHELKRLSPDELLSGLHVLVTDDEPRIREEMFRILTQVGCRVSIAECGSEAIDFLERTKRSGDHLDLVVTDIKLPDINGYEVFSSARISFPDVPVILMTGFGYDPSHSIVRASQEGVAAVLFKPFRTAQLLEAARSALTESAASGDDEPQPSGRI